MSSSPSQASEASTSKPVPVVFQNPDGSMAEGVPPGYKDVSPPRSPRGVRGAADLAALLTGGQMSEFGAEAGSLYERHVRVFTVLLLLQLVIDVAFNLLYFERRDHVITTVSQIYKVVPRETLWRVYWTVLSLDWSYMCLYYSSAAVALYTGRPRHYRVMNTFCFVGCVGQILLAYMNKFNMLVFLLRLIALMYGRFLRQLTQTLLLLPANRGSQGLAPAQAV
mmetsp:Transcript_24092/g.54928  ORF Transcript_24092/g.54928 Transcript_24092/m.54928 type:complete len:223 (+) Transcript_24092:91-759(+)